MLLLLLLADRNTMMNETLNGTLLYMTYRYLAGKMGIITSSESKGLNTFIGTFSLPAIIFLSMAQLDLR